MVVEHYMHPPVHGEHLEILLPGRYENLHRIGSGATSIVYRAHDRFLDLPVAIKCLKSHHSDYHHVRRFQKEAKLMSSLNFVHLPRVFDFGLSQDGHPYMVMELVEGHSLKSIVSRKGALNISTSLAIFLQICSALAYAHNHGIAHRDLKAGNIMVNWNSDGEPLVKLVDFGLASSLNASQEPGDLGVAVGTPLYMSPEQAMGRPTDARSDIYSFGCLMFETLSGRPPIKGDSAAETLSMHIGQRAPLLSKYLHLHCQSLEEIEIVIAIALEKQPGDRYQSIEELEQALSTIAGGEQGDDVEGLFGTGNPVPNGAGTCIAQSFRLNLKEIASNSTKPFSNNAPLSAAAGSHLAGIELSQFMQDESADADDLDQTDDDFCSPVRNLTSSHEALAACLRSKFQTESKHIWANNDDGTFHRRQTKFSRLLDVRVITILVMLVFSAVLVGSIVDVNNSNATASSQVSQSGRSSDSNVETGVGKEQLKQLFDRQVVVAGTQVWCMPGESTEKDLARYKLDMRNVNYLSLCGTQVAGNDLDFIRSWPIETIDARALCLSEKGFASISHVKTLTCIRLDGSIGLTGAKIAKLRALPKLTDIALNRNKISDDILDVLAEMPTLQGLYLNFTDLDDAGLSKLTKIKTLKILTIDGCKNISDSAKKAFHAARPDVNMVI